VGRTCSTWGSEETVRCENVARLSEVCQDFTVGARILLKCIEKVVLSHAEWINMALDSVKFYILW